MGSGGWCLVPEWQESSPWSLSQSSMGWIGWPGVQSGTAHNSWGEPVHRRQVQGMAGGGRDREGGGVMNQGTEEGDSQGVAGRTGGARIT